MHNRIIKTDKVLAMLGDISSETLRHLRMAHPDLLKPVMRGRYSAEKVEQLIDILIGKQQTPAHATNEKDFDAIIMERLQNGKRQGSLSRN